MLKTIGLILVFAIVAFQDWKERQISVWVLVLWGLILGVSFVMEPVTFGIGLIQNLGLLVIQFALLYIYLMVRNRTIKVSFLKMIGLGDLLFLGLMAFSFNAQSFPFLLVGGLVFTLVSFLLISKMVKLSDPKVPLAGNMAIWLIITTVANQMHWIEW